MTEVAGSYLLLRAFVDELCRCGMEAACTSPGSRSTPIVLSLVNDRRLRCYSHIDERSSGFFALGLAKATGLPVAVACTSGTAAAELLPAAIEAHEARVPLLLLTADRPPELREVGAGQAIDQLKLFGSAAKWFFEVGVEEASEANLRWMRTLACRAYWTALEGRPGVVHLNFPLREPLVAQHPLGGDSTGREDSMPYLARPPLRRASLAPLIELAETASRAIVIAGRYERDGATAATAAELCLARGWPLLADPLSGARRGDAAIAHYDGLLREVNFAARMRPDLVIRVGDLPVSKPLRAWLAAMSDVTQVALDPEGAWQDPASVLTSSLAVDAEQALGQLMPAATVPADERDWLGSWRTADAGASEAIHGVIAESGCSEPAVAAELGVLLPPEATLFVASSMPVREIESFWPVRDDPPRVLCNRGANGIDGTLASAFGAAAAGQGPVVLLIGDVALAHDVASLICAHRLELKLTIVLLNNDGGGIFDFLPVASASMARVAADPQPRAGLAEASHLRASEDLYTRHIATPTGLRFAAAAQLYGLSHEIVKDVFSFRAALERSLSAPRAGIIEVLGDRQANVDLHARIWVAASASLRRSA